MIKFNLKREDFLNNSPLQDNFHSFKVETPNTLKLIKEDIEYLISEINIEYKDDLEFHFDHIVDCVKNENLIYILYKEEFPIGYCFLNSSVFFFDTFISKKNKYTSEVPTQFICDVVYDVFQNEELSTLYVECEDEDLYTQTMFIKNGFKVYE